jgi:peptide/nickel transport system ATP-binding protein
MSSPALSVRDLSVSYTTGGAARSVLSNVSFDVQPGHAFGLVGESGCGKSTAAFAIVRHLASNGVIESGSVLVDGEDVLAMNDAELRRLRGKKMSMVYQEPWTALNPVMRIGDQIAEVVRFQEGVSKRAATERTEKILQRVQMPDARAIMRRYPHQLSGGQQQRVVIAMALVESPRVLILDEPTTGLDSTVEAEVLDLVTEVRSEFGAAILYITHNLGLVVRMCESVGVLYAGRIVEQGAALDVFSNPRHPYTAGLVSCVPRLGANKYSQRLEPIPGSLPPLGTRLPGCTFAPRCSLATPECSEAEPALAAVSADRLSRCLHADQVSDRLVAARRRPEAADDERGRHVGGSQQAGSTATLLRIDKARKAYKDVVAVRGVSLDVRQGEVLGLVGESGCGKTTLARLVAGLVSLDSGEMRFEDEPLARRVARRPQSVLRQIQMVFQNPDSTLNPRHSIRYVLSRAIRKLGGTRTVDELAAEVRLEQRHLALRSGELSGGLKQRVAIGRAFAGTPTLVVCDEPVSALDVSVQAAILNLLAELQVNETASYLFISHDLGVIRYIADRIGVMYLGELFEIGETEQVFSGAKHPYTEALLSASATLDAEKGERIRLDGPVPSLSKPPSGCLFHTRCPRKVGPICEAEAPEWQVADEGHLIRCHRSPAELLGLQRHVSLDGSAGNERSGNLPDS